MQAIAPAQVPTTNHAVLYYDEMIAGIPCYPYLHSLGRQELFDHAPRSLEQLLEIAVDRNITHLWVHANYQLEIHNNPCDYALDATVWDVLPNWLHAPDVAREMGTNVLMSLFGRKRRQPGRAQSHDINIIFLDKSTWGWEELTPWHVLNTIAAIENMLGVPVSGSPATTGFKYLRKVQEHKPRYFLPATVDLASIPFDKAARSLTWHRQPTEEESGRRYLVSYDKISAFPRAAVNEDMGIGNPIHLDGNQYGTVVGKPGIWKLSNITEPTANPDMLNMALLPPVTFDRQTWYAAPTVKLMSKLGYSFDIDEGYVFPYAAPVFERWGKNLWAFRLANRDNPVLFKAIKSIMNDTTGFTRAGKLKGNSYKFRPDWYAQIVAGARATMHYNIHRYAAYGDYPVLVYIDAVYYLTDEPNPALAVPGILEHQNSLGGYKVNWKIEVTPAVMDILFSMRSPSKKLELLNAIAESGNEHV